MHSVSGQLTRDDPDPVDLISAVAVITFTIFIICFFDSPVPAWLCTSYGNVARPDYED